MLFAQYLQITVWSVYTTQLYEIMLSLYKMQRMLSELQPLCMGGKRVLQTLAWHPLQKLCCCNA